ncbi:MAG: hypothetical protein AABM67_22660 [Acidobacteriota bacterium]
MVANLKITLRRVLVALIVGSTIIVSASAQELRDRQLKPGIDFTTIQMPFEIVSIKLKGFEIAPEQKLKGDDDWLKGVSFTLKNISDKPIAYVEVGLRFEPPPGAGRVVVFILSYGVDYSRGLTRSGSSPLPIQPDETVDLMLTDEGYPNFLQMLSWAGIPRSFDVVPYRVQRVCFEDDPSIIWEGGYLKRKNPALPGRFGIIERYKLPTRR